MTLDKTNIHPPITLSLSSCLPSGVTNNIPTSASARQQPPPHPAIKHQPEPSFRDPSLPLLMYAYIRKLESLISHPYTTPLPHARENYSETASEKRLECLGTVSNMYHTIRLSVWTHGMRACCEVCRRCMCLYQELECRRSM